MEPRVTRAWKMIPPPQPEGSKAPHIKLPTLRIIAGSSIPTVAVRIKKVELSGEARLVLQSSNHQANRIDSILAVLKTNPPTRDWTFAEVDTTVAETETFSGRSRVVTPDHLQGDPGSSGDTDAESYVESTSTSVSARAFRAEADVITERLAKEAALMIAAEERAAKEEERAAKEAERAAKEAAEKRLADVLDAVKLLGFDVVKILGGSA